MAFLAPEDRLSKEQKAIRSKLCRSSEELKKTMGLVKEFRNMMKNKAGNELIGWIEEVKNSVITELRTFAKGLLTDLKAVENAISLPWSNGPVEGNVNKLKTIKRQMYGRASFELLRKRLILTPN
nr:transposase [Pedobacter panaciterrae]